MSLHAHPCADLEAYTHLECMIHALCVKGVTREG
jgi:hypothetical protein